MARVEAFALNYPDEVPTDERFLGHHTLFDRGFLERLGFTPVRATGQVSLMSIELGGIVPGTSLLRRATGLIRRATQPTLRGAPA